MIDKVTKVETKIPDEPHYVAATKDGWGTEMIGIDPVDYSNTSHAGILGLPITNFTIEASGIKKARVRINRGRWLPYKTGFNTTDGLGNDTPITGIEIVGAGYRVAAHVKGGTWLDPVDTSDKEGEVIIGGGMTIDAIWIDKI